MGCTCKGRTLHTLKMCCNSFYIRKDSWMETAGCLSSKAVHHPAPPRQMKYRIIVLYERFLEQFPFPGSWVHWAVKKQASYSQQRTWFDGLSLQIIKRIAILFDICLGATQYTSLIDRRNNSCAASFTHYYKIRSLWHLGVRCKHIMSSCLIDSFC